MEVKLPNFLIVGSAKAGTTSLYHYLKQHPEVYMPEMKEPRFFVSTIFKELNLKDPYCKSISKDIIFTFEDYIKLFKDAKNERAIGEASPQYLYYYSTAIPCIKKHLGSIKIIIIIRNPIDCAYSYYGHALRDLNEVLPFEKCLQKYIDVFFYYKQISAYMLNFSHVKVFLFNDLKNDALGLIKDVYKFLEVDSSFIPNINIEYNVSGIPKNKFIQNLITKENIFKSIFKIATKIILPEVKRLRLIENFKARNLKKLGKMKPETRQYLKGIYREDILKLQDLLNRDLTHWLR